LETELGGQLFQRGAEMSKLTELGRILYPHFQAIDRSLREVQRITEKRSSCSVPPIRTLPFDLRGVKKVDDDHLLPIS
jgi:DNA-binding transcriptional LysR family regulator